MVTHMKSVLENYPMFIQTPQDVLAAQIHCVHINK